MAASLQLASPHWPGARWIFSTTLPTASSNAFGRSGQRFPMCSAPAIGAAGATARRLDMHRSARGGAAAPALGSSSRRFGVLAKKGVASGVLRDLGVGVGTLLRLTAEA